MTGLPDSIGSGAAQYLSGFSDVTSLLGAFDVADPTNPSVPYVFNDSMLVTLEGTAACAIVCIDQGGWSVPVPLTTPHFCRLTLQVWVDPLRDSDNNIIETSGLTKQRGGQVWAAADSHLHRTNPDVVTWGNMVTVGCERLVEPSWVLKPDGDGIWVGTSFYGVLVFGATA